MTIYLFNFYYSLKPTSFGPKTTFLETIFFTYIIPESTEFSLRNIYTYILLKLFNYNFDFTIKLNPLSFRSSRNYNISLSKFLITDEIFKNEIFTLIPLIYLLPSPFYKPTINYLTFKYFLLQTIYIY